MLIETSSSVTLGVRSYWNLKTTDTVTEAAAGAGGELSAQGSPAFEGNFFLKI
jgi:hypothetical protein